MRSAILRFLGACVSASAVAACGGSPSNPDVPAGEGPSGPSVLNVILLAGCPAFDRGAPPLLYTRVNVTRSGSEWIGTASSAEFGDVEVRFRLSSQFSIAGSRPVTGTMKGTIVHHSALSPPAQPAWSGRANFDATATLTGAVTSPSTLTPVAGAGGSGSGTITATDADGRSCAASTFSWSVVQQ